MTSAEPKYRCQFCGEESPVSEWKADGYVCPRCDREYDALLAQDTETE